MTYIKTLFAISTILLSGCGDNTVSTIDGYTLSYGEGQGINRRSVQIACDSFQMITQKECVFWKGGKKGNIIASEVILVNNVRW